MELTEKLGSLLSKIEQLISEREVLNNQIQNFSSVLQEKDNQIANLQTENDLLRGEIDKLQHENMEVTAQITSVLNKIEGISSVASKLQQDVGAVNGSVGSSTSSTDNGYTHNAFQV